MLMLFHTDEEDLLDVTDYLLGLDKPSIYQLGLVLGLSNRQLKGVKD